MYGFQGIHLHFGERGACQSPMEAQMFGVHCWELEMDDYRIVTLGFLN